MNPHARTLVTALEVVDERTRQDEKWGEQNHPDGTREEGDVERAEVAKNLCDTATAFGQVTWRDILSEEVMEAFAESDPTRLREELIQVAAVAVGWAEAIDRRTAGE